MTSTLTKLADDHFLLSDTQGNVTEFRGQGLMFHAQYDAAGNVTQVVSCAGGARGKGDAAHLAKKGDAADK